MKLSIKKLLLGASALALACAATINLGVSNVYDASAASQPVIDFAEGSVELFDNAYFVTNVETEEETVATAAKFPYVKENVYSGGWCKFLVNITEPLEVDNAYTLSMRFYVHMSTKSSSTPFVSVSSPEKEGDGFVIYRAISAQDEWTTVEISRSDYVLMADAEGKIKHFEVWIYPGDNATLYTDSYVLFDAVIIDDACAVTLDNDKAATGLDTTEVRMKVGDPLEAPDSQVYGKSVTWYSDAERTTPFNFEGATVQRGLTLYAKYSDLVATKGLITDGSKADVRHFQAPQIPVESSGQLGANHLSYVTDLDLDGDGVVEAKNAIKFSGNNQWNSFALEFATPVDVSEIMSVTFRMYVDYKNVPVGCIWVGEGSKDADGNLAPYQHGVIPWGELVQNKWHDYTISAEDSIVKLAGTDGKFDSFLWALGLDLQGGALPFPVGSCIYIDSITYNWKCNVTFDCDTEHSGVEDVEKVYASGKKIVTAPKETAKAGYDVEWYADEARTIPFDLKNERLSGDITLYAKYVTKQLTVTFEYFEDESGIEPVEVKVDYNGKVTAPNVQRDGYKITWFADEDFFDEFDFSQPITKDTTVYAKYTATGGNGGGQSSNSGANSNGLFNCKSSITSGFGMTLAALTGAAAAFIATKKNRKDD